MATGDNDDQFGRLKRLLPQSWFGDNAGVIDALLRGFAHVNAQLFALIAYAKLQTRINTATDGWLDMIAYDFFGNGLPRRPGQPDDSYRAWIKVNLFREKATRKAIVLVVREITGRDPLIIEPANPIDTGAYGGPMIGYGVAGSYGSLSMPYEAFVTVYRSVGEGVSRVAGYRISTSGYSIPSQGVYASKQMVEGDISDADIYAAIDSVKMCGTRVWVRIL